MSLVAGEKYEVEIYDGSVWKTFVCRRDANFNVQTEMIETSVTGSGNRKTFKPTVSSATVGMSGLTALNVPGFVTLPELISLQLANTKILFRLLNTAIDLTVYIRQFYAYITNIADTGSFDGVSSFQLSAQVTGNITQIFTPPTPITAGDMRYPEQGDTAPATTGSFSWDLPGLTPSNTKLTNVEKDGRGSNNIILSGTPVGNEVLFEANGSDGLLTWAVPFEDGETPPYITYTQI